MKKELENEHQKKLSPKSGNVNYVLVSDIVPSNELWYYAGYFHQLSPNSETLPKNTNEYARAMKIPFRDEAQVICDNINNTTQNGIKFPFTYHVEEHMYM